jgi:tetratricopeptide (TPR) repeat protein
LISCDAIAALQQGQRGVLVMKKWFTSSWRWIVGLTLLLAVPLGFHYFDRWAADACTRQGRSLVNSKQYPQAIDQFNKAIQIDPKYAPAYHGRGVAFLDHGETDRAIADFGEAIRLDASDARSRYHRAVAYARKKQLDQALADLTEAIRLNPTYAAAYLTRSWVYTEKGEADRAKADRQKAAELDPALEKSASGNP